MIHNQPLLNSNDQRQRHSSFGCFGCFGYFGYRLIAPYLVGALVIGCGGGILGGEDGGGNGGDGGGDGNQSCGDNDYVTPGSEALSPVTFSVGHGFYEQPFEVTIQAQSTDATIIYTLDGSTPSLGNGNQATSSVTVPITTTTVLRARAVLAEAATHVYTQTYIFVDDVLGQPANVEGYPHPPLDIGGGGQVADLDYQMDPEVVTNPVYAAEMKDALVAIPSISIVTDIANLFGPEGLYTHGGSGGQNKAFERSASIELIVPGRPNRGFQIDAGIRPHSHVVVKRSFKVVFRGKYGPKKLRSCIFKDAPLNGDSAVQKFDRFILRAGLNRSWATFWNTDDSVYTRDQWVHDSQTALSGRGLHGSFVHLYINGLYWGLYNPIERADAWFASEYDGGKKNDWFAINHGGPIGKDADDPTPADSSRWDHLMTLADRDLTVAANYAEISEYLDLNQFADYLILNWYAGNDDWPTNNWYANVQNTPPGPVRFYVWDAEDTWDSEASSGPFDRPGGRGNDGAWVHPAFRPGSNNNAPLARLWRGLRRNDAFMTLFAERVDLALAGALSDQASIERWNQLNNVISVAILGESARWGDTRETGRASNGTVLNEPVRTRDESWSPEVSRVANESIPGNGARLIEKLREVGYYPSN